MQVNYEKKVFNLNKKNNSDVIIYVANDGVTHIDVKLENDTVWLTQQQMTELFEPPTTKVAGFLLR